MCLSSQWLQTCARECIQGNFHNSRAYTLLAIGDLLLLQLHAKRNAFPGEDTLTQAMPAPEDGEVVEKEEARAKEFFEAVRFAA